METLVIDRTAEQFFAREDQVGKVCDVAFMEFGAKAHNSPYLADDKLSIAS
jgi:hypothetical protein